MFLGSIGHGIVRYFHRDIIRDIHLSHGAYFRSIGSFLSSTLETDHIGLSERLPWPWHRPLEITELFLVPNSSLLLPCLELSIGQVLVRDSPWGTITLLSSLGVCHSLVGPPHMQLEISLGPVKRSC